MTFRFAQLFALNLLVSAAGCRERPGQSDLDAVAAPEAEASERGEETLRAAGTLDEDAAAKSLAKVAEARDLLPGEAAPPGTPTEPAGQSAPSYTAAGMDSSEATPSSVPSAQSSGPGKPSTSAATLSKDYGALVVHIRSNRMNNRGVTKPLGIRDPYSVGSGIILSGGHVATLASFEKRNATLEAHRSDGKVSVLTRVHTSTDGSIAFYASDFSDAPAGPSASLASIADTQAGDELIGLARPSLEGGLAVTRGLVNSIDLQTVPPRATGLMLLDAANCELAEGGPLFDKEGQVVGLTFVHSQARCVGIPLSESDLPESSSSPGAAAAARPEAPDSDPVQPAEQRSPAAQGAPNPAEAGAPQPQTGTRIETLESAVAQDLVTPPYKLGLRVKALDEVTKRALDAAQFSGAGIVVTDIVKSGPADASGLRIGDVITHVDGTPMTLDALANLKGKIASNTSLTVQIIRHEERLTLKLIPLPDR